MTMRGDGSVTIYAAVNWRYRKGECPPRRTGTGHNRHGYAGTSIPRIVAAGVEAVDIVRVAVGISEEEAATVIIIISVISMPVAMTVAAMVAAMIAAHAVETATAMEAAATAVEASAAAVQEATTATATNELQAAGCGVRQVQG